MREFVWKSRSREETSLGRSGSGSLFICTMPGYLSKIFSRWRHKMTRQTQTDYLFP